MPRILVVWPDGRERELEAAVGSSILDLARAENLPLEGTCGGQMACATCHVLVDADWHRRLPRPSPEEAEMISLAVRPRRTSRLGCQVRLTDEHDGLRFEVIGE